MFKMLQQAGHEIVIVTGRSPVAHWKEEAENLIAELTDKFELNRIPIVFSGTEWKRVSAEKAGHNINIWIDNSPEYIGKQWLLKSFEISKDNLFSPETSGIIRKNLEACIKDAWIKKMQELKIYPKRVTDAEVKEELWKSIDNEAQEFIQLLLNELSETTD
jgi:hypothetical protein